MFQDFGMKRLTPELGVFKLHLLIENSTNLNLVSFPSIVLLLGRLFSLYSLPILINLIDISLLLS